MDIESERRQCEPNLVIVRFHMGEQIFGAEHMCSIN